MVKLKREQKQQEELNKIKERDSFNIKCDYLTQVELRKKREQQAMIHQYYENLHNENLKLIEAKRANKESNLQQHQKFLDYVEFQKLAESDQRKKDKDNLKLLHQNYYDTFVNKKKQEEIKKQEDTKLEIELMKVRNIDQEKRNKEYRDKLSKNTRKIMENNQNQIRYLGDRDASGIPPSNGMNDYEYNLKKKEDHEFQQSLNRNLEKDMLEERLRSLGEYNSYVKSSKIEKLEEQKKYKEILDSQVEKNLAEGKKHRFVYDTNNEFILPSYSHPNRAVPNVKRAVDHVNRLRHSYDLGDKSRMINDFSAPISPLIKNTENIINDLNSNNLKSNPISLPYSDFRYNKYIERDFNKLQKVYENSQYHR